MLIFLPSAFLTQICDGYDLNSDCTIWESKTPPVFQSKGPQLIVVIKSGKAEESRVSFYGWKMRVYFVSGTCVVHFHTIHLF